MNRTSRGPILLTLAGVFLLFALIAYLISDAEYNQARHEAALRQQEELRRQNQVSIADRAELHLRQDTIMESLKRLEELNRQIEAIRAQIEKLKRDRDEHRVDNQAAHQERGELRRDHEAIKKMLSDILEMLRSTPAPRQITPASK